MKIAIFVPAWPPGVTANGIVTYASHLVPALRSVGHEVFVITPQKVLEEYDPYTIELGNFSLAPRISDRILWALAPPIGAFRRFSSAISRAVQHLVNEHKIDVFEIEESFGWGFATSRLNLLPVVVRLHGPWCLYNKFNDPGDNNAVNRRREKLEGRGIKLAHFVTANCTETLRAVKDYYRLDLLKSKVIPTPITTVPHKKTWKIETCNKNGVLFVGRFDKLKGGDLVLRAFAELAASNRRLHLTFVGPNKGIEDADGNIYNFDRFLQSNFPEWLRPQIEYCGQMTHADLMSIRTKHLITVIAARVDTMGYMLLEPMSFGCPLVATAVGGIPEVIKHQHNGLLVPSEDVKGLIAACQSLLGHHELATRLGQQAWLDCRKYYSPEVVARQTVAAYQEAIDAFKFSSPRATP